MARGKNTSMKANAQIKWDLTGAAPKAPEKSDYPAIKQALAQLPLLSERKEQVGLIALVGSHGYGLAHKDSDLDFRGFYIASSDEILGLDKPKEQIECDDPDFSLFEVDKFCRLALSANPNVLEIMWADAVWDTKDARILRDNRDAFLSIRVRDSYLGYAKQQMKLALKGGRDHLYVTRREKAIRHLFRLYEQGYELLATGNLNYRLADPERIKALGKVDNAQLEKEFNRLDKKLKNLTTDLPEEPNRELINQLLIDIRHRHLKGKS